MRPLGSGAGEKIQGNLADTVGKGKSEMEPVSQDSPWRMKSDYFALSGVDLHKQIVYG